MPPVTPAPPSPAMARPTIRVTLFWATPREGLVRGLEEEGGAGEGSVSAQHTANQTPQLKEEDGRQEGELEIEVLVRLAPRRLEDGEGDEEGGGVPADVGDRLCERSAGC